MGGVEKEVVVVEMEVGVVVGGDGGGDGGGGDGGAWRQRQC